VIKLLRERPVRAELLRLADGFPERWGRFCRALAQAEGWSCLHETERCVERVRRVLNSGHRPGHAPRNFDVDWAFLACDFFPESELAPLFGRRQAVAQARRELEEAEGEQQGRVASPRVA
jgi:hypothetical protein